VALPVYLETLEKLTDEDAVVFSVSGNCAFRVFEISSGYGRTASVLAPDDNGKVIIEGFNNSTSNYMVLVVGLHDTGKQNYDVIVELADKEEDFSGTYVGLISPYDTEFFGMGLISELDVNDYVDTITISLIDESSRTYLINVHLVFGNHSFTGQISNRQFEDDEFTIDYVFDGNPNAIVSGFISLDFSGNGEHISGVITINAIDTSNGRSYTFTSSNKLTDMQKQ